MTSSTSTRTTPHRSGNTLPGTPLRTQLAALGLAGVMTLAALLSLDTLAQQAASDASWAQAKPVPATPDRA